MSRHACRDCGRSVNDPAGRPWHVDMLDADVLMCARCARWDAQAIPVHNDPAPSCPACGRGTTAAVVCRRCAKAGVDAPSLF